MIKNGGSYNYFLKVNMNTSTPNSPTPTFCSNTATTGENDDHQMPLRETQKKITKHTVRLNIIVKETQKKLCTLRLPQ